MSIIVIHRVAIIIATLVSVNCQNKRIVESSILKEVSGTLPGMKWLNMIYLQ